MTRTATKKQTTTRAKRVAPKARAAAAPIPFANFTTAEDRAQRAAALAPAAIDNRPGRRRLFGFSSRDLASATHDNVLQLAGLDWTAEKVPLAADGIEVPSHVAIRRSDTKQILGVVGTDYQPLQNAEMVEFYRKVGDYVGFSYETGGAFSDGRTVFLLANMKAADLAIGDDLVKPYFLISNGHVGNRKLTMAPTTVRVVCQNTLAMASRQIRGEQRAHGQCVEAGYQIRHFSGIKRAIDDVREAYIQASRAWKQTGEALQLLASKPLTAEAFEAMMRTPFEVDASKDETNIAKAFRDQREARLHAILASDTCQVKGTAGTLFAGLQAITEYADHEWPIRAGENKAERRAFGAQISGEGSNVKARAFGLALELAGA